MADIHPDWKTDTRIAILGGQAEEVAAQLALPALPLGYVSNPTTIVDIYNAAFYSDYLRYGQCPAYGKTKEMMERSILEYSKFLILYDSRPVGCLSCKETGKGTYEVGCLCVIPEFQGKGIGTAAMEFAKSHFKDWNRFTLVTPADKSENIRFYTEKCGFAIRSVEKDGKVEVIRFVLEK